MDDEFQELEQFQAHSELDIYRDYREVIDDYKYVVETERRLYLANEVNISAQNTISDSTSLGGGNVFFEVTLEDAWVWDMYRKGRKIKEAHIVTFKDVNIEEVNHQTK
ncbi:MAG: DUF2469 domain-containing protein [Candidatus Ancillula sp.]|jgi:hypothetical protein|nr:DUF2469 domain-containing protein [Candidatus Ancillula sp.]